MPFNNQLFNISCLKENNIVYHIFIYDKSEAYISLVIGNKLMTDTERKVLYYLSRGLLIKEISKEMGVSGNTVNFHLKNLYKKYQANDKLGLLRKLNLIKMFF